ncbi:hypothetical protein PY310_13530 [Pseudarthrobacter sp. H3Y2-7]|jgi:hypothetical protein|uniref:hypothetical protein n=1 Tax=Pseudarthrobacter TaxID=1742993 RepID=UPI0023B0AB26|nr:MULTISPECIES: hypothetical protein [unclassified Pseudarthrobacter]MDE8669599.1 hypothetical protein [Pseudarthrobacter sp. H3Y2-7]
MPWWSWILIWIALIAVSLLFYVLLGIRLYRQGMAVLKDLGAASSKLGHLAVAPSPATTGELQHSTQVEPGAAVFASPARMRHDYDASKSSRREDRRQRRVQRKHDRGQPQSLRDLDLN